MILIPPFIQNAQRALQLILQDNYQLMPHWAANASAPHWRSEITNMIKNCIAASELCEVYYSKNMLHIVLQLTKYTCTAVCTAVDNPAIPGIFPYSFTFKYAGDLQEHWS
jgi:hypothetical protein